MRLGIDAFLAVVGTVGLVMGTVEAARASNNCYGIVGINPAQDGYSINCSYGSCSVGACDVVTSLIVVNPPLWQK